MIRRVRILDPPKPVSFSEQLEAGARAALKHDREGRRRDDSPIRRVLDAELALIVGELDRERALHRDLGRNITLLECYVGTEILQRTPRPPVYQDERLPERDMLRGRLLRLEHERRRVKREHHEKLRDLHERLLTVMSKRRVAAL